MIYKIEAFNTNKNGFFLGLEFKNGIAETNDSKTAGLFKYIGCIVTEEKSPTTKKRVSK
ncbi:hypothetical protein MHB65_19970 [Lysinibacillus sp. FSL K6-0075]|uniref:hypothetical protein n=1 Tax=Lysinibacillus sp. FSL K6-0075 TaxID=2921415 RepID=UPI0031591F2B